MLRVCYVVCTTVTVNDRGPYIAGRTLDLQQALAENVGLTTAGVDYVEAVVIRWSRCGESDDSKKGRRARGDNASVL